MGPDIPPSNPAPPPDAFVGMEVGGAVLARRIGEGGMGLVYEAWQEDPGRRVAVKLMRDVLASEDARFRFRHEARVLAGLEHPGIARIYSAGTHRATTEIPYFVMEFVADAQPVTAWIREHQPDRDAILRLGVAICHAVQAGHARGVIHRDLKPANILVDAEGHPKLIDFGIARTQDRAPQDTPQTKTGQFVGTIPYMSPEQFRGRGEVDVRSDVHALGVILYEMLTGRLPWGDADLGVMETIGAIQHRAPTPPERHREDLAGDPAIVLGKALAKDPARRYQSAAALADDLDRFLDTRPIEARAPSMLYQAGLFVRRRTALAAALALTGVSIVGALVAISIYAGREADARHAAEAETRRATALLHAATDFVPVVADHITNKLGALMGTTRVRGLLADELGALSARLSAVEGAAGDAHVAHALGVSEETLAGIRGAGGSGHEGDSQAALDHFRLAVERFGQAHAAEPDNPRHRRAQWSAQTSLANLHAQRGDLDAAEGALHGAGEGLEAWIAAEPGNLTAQGFRIDLERTRAFIHWMARRYEPALTHYQRILAWTLAFPFQPDHERARVQLHLRARRDVGETLLALERTAEAAEHYEAIRDLAAGLETAGSRADLQHARWSVHTTLGAYARATGDAAGTEAHLRKAQHAAETMHDRSPGDVAARNLLSQSRQDLGMFLEQAGRPVDALPLYIGVLEAAREDAAREPEHHTLEWDLRVALTRLGAVRTQVGAFDLAEPLLAEALEIQTRRMREAPDDAEESAGVSELEKELAYLDVGRAEALPAPEAASLLERAASRLDGAADRLARLDPAGLSPAFLRNVDVWRSQAERLRAGARSMREEDE